MALVIEAIYEDGILKPLEPIPLAEHDRVQVTIEVARDALGASHIVIPDQNPEPAHEPSREHSAAIEIQRESAVNRVRATYGLLGWTGDPQVLRRIAEDDEFGILESP